MTINNTILGRVSYIGNGTATVFTVPFVFNVASDLEVIRTVISTGAETVLTINSDYTVSGGGLIPATGSITFGTAPTSAQRITIRRKVPNTQLVDFVENDTLPAAVQESALDKLTLQIQDLKENVDRAVLFTPGSGQSAVSIGAAVPNFVLTWNSTGTVITSLNPATLIGPQGPAGPAGANGQGVPTGGTAGQVLAKIDGTNFNTQWINAGGGSAVVLLDTKTITTNTASVAFNTGFSSTYDKYIIEGFVQLNTSNASLRFRLSTDGGSTLLSSGISSAIAVNTGSIVSTNLSNANRISFPTGSTTIKQAEGIYFKLEIFKGPLTTNGTLTTSYFDHSTSGYVASSGSFFVNSSSLINYLILDEINAFNISNAKIYVYGVKNS